MNEEALWSPSTYGYDIDDSCAAVVKCGMFAVLTISYLVCIVRNFIILTQDIVQYYHQTLGKKYYKTKIMRQPNPAKSWNINTNICCRIVKWYRKTFRIDSGLWVAWAILRETFEIFVQSQALLSYNGSYLSSQNNKDNDTVSLAYESKYIKLFAVFLLLNCVTCGILWMFYAFKPLFCHGLIYQLILHCCDALFDIFYALFPLMVVFNSTDTSISDYRLVSLAALQTDTLLIKFIYYLKLFHVCLLTAHSFLFSGWRF